MKSSLLVNLEHADNQTHGAVVEANFVSLPSIGSLSQLLASF
jgi:hypothetical protein